MKHLEHIVLLRPMGSCAIAVNQQLKKEKEDFSRIKSALYTAFAMDGLPADEQFTKRCLPHSGNRLTSTWQSYKDSVLFREMSDRDMACAFVRRVTRPY